MGATTRSLLLLALCASTLGIARKRNPVLNIPSSPGDGASDVLDPSYLGFAFEQASFYNYSFDADGNANALSHNLIDAIQRRTGGKPIIRVGGTSGDMGRYEESQSYAVNRPATKGGPAFRKPFLTVGPSFFEAFRNFPDAQYIFMVPLAHKDHNNSMEWARKGLEIIGDRLQAIDIGNEPDLYDWFEMGEYVKEFQRCQDALLGVLPENLKQRPIFQALDTAWGGGRGLTTSAINTSDALQAGLNSTGAVSQIAYHLYQAHTDPTAGLDWLQQYIANHTAIVNNMALFQPHIDYLRKNAPGVPFVLSEVGNSLGSKNLGLRNIFATALWNLDYQLHAMAMGVDRVNNQQIAFPGFQMWVPVQTDFDSPVVRPNWYSQPMAAEFIGSSGKTRVAEIDLPDTDVLSAYIAYEGDKPARIAIVNMDLWTPANGTRPNAGVTINGLGNRIKSAKILKLVSPEGAFDTQFITWRGLQWTAESNGQETRVGQDHTRVYINKGKAKLNVEATSAMIVDLEDCSETGLCHEL